MTAQRHIIKRQVLELKVRSVADAHQLQTEVSRIYRQRIVPLIDQYCTELSDPDLIHRIDVLEVNLGAVNPQHLEEDLVNKVRAELRTLLAEHISTQERKADGSGANLKTTSQLELLSVFAQSGSLPWWADTSQPHLLDDCLRYLMQRADGPLRQVMQALAQEQTALQRLVHHYADRFLADLAATLAPALDFASQAHIVPDLVLVLQRTALGAVQPQTRLRHVVWSVILQQLSRRGEQQTAWPPFVQAVLLRVAGQLGVAYTALLSGIHQVMQQDQARLQSQIAETVEILYSELLRTPLDARRSLPRALSRDGYDVIPARSWPEPITSVGPERTLSGARAGSKGKSKDAHDQLPGRPGMPKLEQDVDIYPGQTASGVLVHLWPLLRALAMRLPSRSQAHVLVTLDRLERDTPDGDVFTELVRLLGSQTVQQGLPVTLLQRWRAEVERVAMAGFARDEVVALTELLQHVVQEGGSPRRPDKVVPLDLTVNDADELYIDNAGLVILHPFLRYFFARLDLLEDKQFKDMASRQRAIGLLQYAVSEDPSPPEYLLPLNKVLCGMELDDVFDFGLPVTEAEAEECANLLTAVIANAPILQNMSVNGLRGTFLLRRGVLSSRDGAWLLRVERETYDVVLDRFPWTMQWVKLPWMDAPLRIEW